jgi:5-methylcytosine-specific restriction endonuclease McrA
MELEGDRHMRFTNEDKKKIAKAQGQYAYEEDWVGNLRFIGYRCRRCKKVFTRLSDFQVDHIKPRSKRGTDNPANLQLLCPTCNRKKSNKIKLPSSMTARRRTTTKRKTTTVKGKASTVKRKPKTFKRKTSTTKRKTTAVERSGSTVWRRRR